MLEQSTSSHRKLEVANSKVVKSCSKFKFLVNKLSIGKYPEVSLFYHRKDTVSVNIVTRKVHDIDSNI